VRQLRAEGLGVLLVEQNAIAAMELADRALLMLSGEVRRSADAGSGDDLIADYFSSELNEGNGSRA
jgi:ABC-type branched-subunit amino acid transport system ATPase component